MKGILADTSVLIDFFQGKATVKTKEVLGSHLISISMLTYLEVLRFFYKAGKTTELEFIKQRLTRLDILPFTTIICDKAARIAHSNKMSMADAIIYATAQEHGLTLVTSDSDFKGKDGVLFLEKEK